jgi:hypothetical protein
LAFVRRRRRPNSVIESHDFFGQSTKYLEAIEPRPATITPIGRITMCRLRSVASAFRYYRPMLDTDSALFDLIVAPVLAAVFAFPRTPLLVMPHA